MKQFIEKIKSNENLSFEESKAVFELFNSRNRNHLQPQSVKFESKTYD